MPFFDPENTTFSTGPQRVEPELQTSGSSSSLQAFKTSIESIPIVRAPAEYLTDQIFMPDPTPDANFNPLDPQLIAGREQFKDSYATANNKAQWDYIDRKITQRLREEDIMSASPYAAFAGQMLDPVFFVPFAGAGAKVATSALGKVAESVGRTAATGFAASAVNEGLRVATDPTRTREQSLEAVGTTTFISGLLGGAYGGYLAAKGGEAGFSRVANKAMEESAVFAHAVEAVQGGSVGAAAVPKLTLAQEALKNSLGAEKVFSFQDPVLRTAVSSSVVTRRIAQDLAEQPLARAKNAEGIASPIAAETLIRNWQGPLITANEQLEDLFVQYRLGRERQAGDMARLSVSDVLKRGPALTEEQFAEEVGRAMRRGDKHDIPEVANAAKVMRREIFDPLKNDATTLGLFDEGMKTRFAESYTPRKYDVPKIIAERPAFEKAVADFIRQNADELHSILSKKDGAAASETASKAAPKRLEGADLEDFIKQTVNDVTDQITGNPLTRTEYRGTVLTRGPFKERTLAVPDYVLEPWLESDIRKLAHMHVKTMGTDIELTRKFGSADMADQIAEIKADYQKLRNGITDAKKLEKLDKQMKADIRDVEGMRDRLRGTYNLPSDPVQLARRTGAAVRNLNYISMLGGMTLTAISDLARSPMVLGFTNTFRDGIVPLVSNFKGFRLAANEVKLAGNAADMVLNDRIMSILDIGEEFAKTTKFERGLEYAANKMGLVSLMAPWNASMKQFAGVVIQSKMLRAINKVPSAKEAEHLAFLGIDARMAKRIGAEFAKHGKEDGGVHWANTDAWTDKGAVTAYRSALSKEVNIVIVTPGQDRPLFMSKPLGQTLMQFKSFGISANQRILMSGLQQRDLSALSGVALSVSLGMLAYKLKTPEEKLAKEPAQWVAEGIDRSGVTGSLFDVNNLMEKATQGKIGVARLTGKEMSRYASRDVAGALMGPSYSTAQNTASVIGHALQGKWSQSDTHALRRMLPFQNLFYIRYLLDEAEKGVNRAFGVPKKSGQ